LGRALQTLRSIIVSCKPTAAVASFDVGTDYFVLQDQGPLAVWLYTLALQLLVGLVTLVHQQREHQKVVLVLQGLLQDPV
jgi:hypothetical protein